jgi:hypothetical protein
MQSSNIAVKVENVQVCAIRRPPRIGDRLLLL